MLCAHTVRRLKPGAFDEFRERFVPRSGEVSRRWVRFHMLRGVHDENEVVTFGFFDGTLEELERGQADERYDERRASVEPLVEAVIANGVYEVVEELTLERSPS